MAVGLTAPDFQSLLPVPGFALAPLAAGLRQAQRLDLLLMALAPATQVGAVFTRNRFCAAPIQVCRTHLAQRSPRALIINTGCANAGTGQQGLEDARTTCAAVARTLALDPLEVLPFSTGVILEPLPMAPLLAAIARAPLELAPDKWGAAAHAIMTTDTIPKACSRQLKLAGHQITITGIAKGAGMIRPNMATMLGFIATDANIAGELLQALTQDIADASFNRITVDGDTSTNDSFLIMASGQAAHPRIESCANPDFELLRQALEQVALELAHAIIRDGEGATKFVTIRVEQGASEAECLQIAYAVAHSPLVKTAFFASDPNLGRILAAIGYAGVADLEVAKVRLFLDEVLVAEQGGRAAGYREEQGQRVLSQPEFTVRVQLERGSAATAVWTCDLSHDYVRINAEYRS